jgi:hypothetical protein
MSYSSEDSNRSQHWHIVASQVALQPSANERWWTPSDTALDRCPFGAQQRSLPSGNISGVSGTRPARTTALQTPAVDHVLLATPDLDVASRVLSDRYGLMSIEGGQHPAWGTANSIVPVQRSYLELVAVVDERAAKRSVFGRWVASATASVLRPIGWAVRPRSLDAAAQRLGLDIEDGSRTTPSGQVLTWRLAGVEVATVEPFLPFFIEWGVDAPHPSGALGADSNDAVEITRLDLTGVEHRLRSWLHEDVCPITVGTGPPGVTRVVLSTPGGDVALDASFR